MSQIKHDASGFLVGELIESSKAMLTSQQASMGIWRGIRADVSAIARAMGVASRANSAQGGSRSVAEPVRRVSVTSVGTRSYGARGQIAEPRARDAGGRFLPSSIANKSAIKDIADKPGVTSAVATIRDEKGRFGSNGVSDGGGSSERGIADRMGRVVDALKGLSQNGEGVDPAITAMGEIKSVLEPLGRGAFALFGRGEKQGKERWYSKFLKALTAKKDPVVVSGGGGGDDGIGVALPARLIAGIGAALVAALGVIGAAGLGAYIGTKIYEWLDKSGIATKIFDAFDAIGAWFKEKVVKPLADAKEGVKNVLLDKVGFKPLDSSNDPLSKEYQDRQKKSRAGKSVSELRALETGDNYKAGNIGGLNDAQTRALVASTALTESAGGKLGIENSAGYMGRYQAGAGWLADAGLIKGGSKAVGAAMKEDGFSKEYDWGKSGGMSRFLKDDANWNEGMNYKSYMGSAEVQDKAFKTNSDSAYKSLMRSGSINESTPPEQVAGLLKARHLAGLGGAMKVAAGGTGGADANGTTARKYYNDVAADKNGFLSVYSGKTATAGAQNAIPSAVPMSVPQKIAPVVDPAIPASTPNEKDKPVTVVVKDQVGQNVQDRTIAHTASGGIGSGGSSGSW